jgi:hypothetical protein
MGWKGSLK